MSGQSLTYFLNVPVYSMIEQLNVKMFIIYPINAIPVHPWRSRHHHSYPHLSFSNSPLLPS